MCLLDAGGFEVFQDHLGKRLLGAVVSAGFGDAINQFVVLVHAEHAVRGKALDGERPGHANYLLVVVGLVVEVFELGLGGDRRIDLTLAGDALFPPLGMELLGCVRPFGIDLAWNLPFFEGFERLGRMG